MACIDGAKTQNLRHHRPPGVARDTNQTFPQPPPFLFFCGSRWSPGKSAVCARSLPPSEASPGDKRVCVVCTFWCASSTRTNAWVAALPPPNPVECRAAYPLDRPRSQAAVYPGSDGGDVRCLIVPNFEEVHLWQVERFGHKRKQSNDQVRKLTKDPTRVFKTHSPPHPTPSSPNGIQWPLRVSR